jgi:hypothetical protein
MCSTVPTVKDYDKCETRQKKMIKEGLAKGVTVEEAAAYHEHLKKHGWGVSG